jgi:hypothetical protein
MATENRDIKYLNKDFGDLRNALIEFTKTYFPSTYNDFSPSSPGMMFMEMSAYIGDVLSFYLDNQIQETFAQYARQESNLYSLAYMLGYKPKVTGAATVSIDFYQKIPLAAGKPDYDYAVYIPNNTVLSSNIAGASNFLLTSPVDFSFSSHQDPTEITAVPPTTPGGPVDYYLLKKTREAVSGNVQTKTFTFGTTQRFQTIEINDSSIIQILDITDSDGNIWYEVPYLAQEMIIDSINNTETDSAEVPYLLQLKKVPRRFVSRFISPTTLQIQFGAGTTTANIEEEVIPNPNNIGSTLTGGTPNSFINTAYDPANFLYTSTYGISPSNTTLTVRYLTGGGVSSNIPANSLNTITNTTSITFPSGINSFLSQEIKNSVIINNPVAATGGQNGDTVEELRFNSLASFGTQLRTVTQADYIIRALSLPSQYGSLAKVYAEPEKLENLLPGESLSATNLYVLAYDNNKNLKAASPSLKNNLKQYLSQYRMVNDSIKIRDGYVINISVGFDIIVLPNFNNNDVLLRCINAVKDYFNIDKWQINESIILKDIYILLDKINGVQTVSDVRITNMVGGNYSQWAFDIPGATSGNVIYPSVDPMVFEVKYPDIDIKGRVVSL